MARWYEPTAQQMAEWRKWVRSRPRGVQATIRDHGLEPWSLYRLKSTGQRVYLYSVSENGTVTVDITPQFNLMPEGWRVFGVDPDDLEPCELPGKDDLVGLVEEFMPAELADLLKGTKH